ncbi:ATP-binding protein [Streptomyces sp. AHA2]|uniref:ATP-binding protein n=1 Tax=Streptomyces sp. AHA2 TaxID=3064526 RepID=UPI002FE236D5
MIIPLMKQAADESHAPVLLRYGAVWGPEGTSVFDARNATRTLLAQAGYPPHHRADHDARIVVSELVTNALRDAPGPGGLLLEVLACTPARLRITVRDSSRRSPRPRVPDPHRIGGHGLQLISRICDTFHTTSLPDGKKITAEIRLPAAAL